MIFKYPTLLSIFKVQYSETNERIINVSIILQRNGTIHSSSNHFDSFHILIKITFHEYTRNSKNAVKCSKFYLIL